MVLPFMIPVFVAFIIANDFFAIDGDDSVFYTPEKRWKSQELFPKQFFRKDGGVVQIVNEPVYWSYVLPRKPTSVDMTVEYRYGGDSTIEVGAEKYADQMYDMTSLDHPLLNRLLVDADWSVKKENDLLFFQKKGEKNHDSIADFLSEPPDFKQWGVYFFDRSPPFLEEGNGMHVSESSEAFSYENPVTLIGKHTFVVPMRSGNEIKRLTLSNAAESSQEIRMEIRDDRGRMRTYEDTLKSHETKRFSLTTDTDAVYTVSLNASDSVFLSHDREDGFLYADNIRFGDEKNVTFFTDADEFSVWADTYQGMQTVLVNGKEYAIDKVKVPVRIQRDASFPPTYEVMMRKGNTSFFSHYSWFFRMQDEIPFRPRHISPFTDVATSQIRFIVAKYDEPQPLPDGWKRVKKHFPAEDFYRKDNEGEFIFSVPYKKNEDQFFMRNISLLIHYSPMYVEDIVRIIGQKFSKLF